MINIDKWSNTNVPGLWMFKVGPLAALENVIPPDTGVNQGKQIIGSVRSSRSACPVLTDTEVSIFIILSQISNLLSRLSLCTLYLFQFMLHSAEEPEILCLDLKSN